MAAHAGLGKSRREAGSHEKGKIGGRVVVPSNCGRWASLHVGHANSDTSVLTVKKEVLYCMSEMSGVARPLLGVLPSETERG